MLLVFIESLSLSKLLFTFSYSYLLSSDILSLNYYLNVISQEKLKQCHNIRIQKHKNNKLHFTQDKQMGKLSKMVNKFILILISSNKPIIYIEIIHSQTFSAFIQTSTYLSLSNINYSIIIIIIFIFLVSINIDMSEKLKSQQPLKNKKIKKDNIKTQQQKVEGLKKGQPVMQSDKRFSKAQYDPKFMAPSSKITKIKIDKRFSKMLKDPAFKTNSSIDRYGRTINQNSDNKQLEEYYYMQDQQRQNKEQDDGVKQDVVSNQQIQEKVEQEQEEGIREWMQNYNQQSSSQIQDMDVQDVDQDLEKLWSDQSQNVVKGTNVNATNRLALCSYDWMNISAKDLMLLFNSFKTKSGYIRSIKVYMSDIGKQKLQKQQQFGPTGIWRDQKQVIQKEEISGKKEWKKSWKQLLDERQQKQRDAFDQTKLRKYQKQRLKYFYAVIECDSKQTADQIYKECDGNQFENSNLQFDLRFIPDEIQFDRNNLKQQCNDLPMTGLVKNFVNRALGHTKVNLSWEDPELSLSASLKKLNWNNLTEAELDKVDWNMYINQDQLKQDDQMKKMTNDTVKQSETTSDWKKNCNKKYRKNDDIEITFEGGFDTKKKGNSKVKEQDIPSLNKQKKSMKERWRQNDLEKKKKREQLSLLVQTNNKPDFKFNTDDERFGAVYDNPLYAIDPVDSRFDHRHSGQIFAEVVKRNKNKNKE